MTNLSIRRARGFTLIELLVVIAIIAVLAAGGFAAGLAALKRARKVSALNTATSIQQAVNNFYNEYNYLPSSAVADATLLTDEALGKDMLIVLAGKEPDSATMLNAKSINFLAVKEGKKSGTRGRDGIIFTDSGVPEGIYDPWGGSYKIRLDLDYDDKLSVTPKGAISTEHKLNSRRVAVWTDGEDGKGTANGKTTDDVVTW